MKTHSKARHRSTLTLGDLILAVSSSAKTRRETVAALTDLINSGRVSLATQHARIRFT